MGREQTSVASRAGLSLVAGVAIGAGLCWGASRVSIPVPRPSPTGLVQPDESYTATAPTAVLADRSGCASTFCPSGWAGPVSCENDGGTGGWVCGPDGQWVQGQSDTPCVCVDGN